MAIMLRALLVVFVPFIPYAQAEAKFPKISPLEDLVVWRFKAAPPKLELDDSSSEIAMQGSPSRHPSEDSLWRLDKGKHVIGFDSDKSVHNLDIEVVLPVLSWNNFESTEAYLVLKATWYNGKLKYDISYWIGSQAPKEKKRSILRYATQLDERLGRTAEMHRELEDMDTVLFKSFFVKDRGVKLYVLKGNTSPRIVQLKENYRNLNKEDTFVLDSRSDIFIIKGDHYHELQPLVDTFVKRLHEIDHEGKGKVFTIDELRSGASENMDQFLDLLGASDQSYLSTIGPTAPTTPSEFEEERNKSVKLSKVILREDGQVELRNVDKGRALELSFLEAEACYILNSASEAGLSVWLGGDSDKRINELALMEAERIVRKNEFSRYFPDSIKFVQHGKEDTQFLAQFSDGLTNICNEKHSEVPMSIDAPSEAPMPPGEPSADPMSVDIKPSDDHSASTDTDGRGKKRTRRENSPQA